MGGNDGIRGYLLQTIICVLDALQNDNDWLSVAIEPFDASEKVDIKWTYSDGYIKVCQVKSSRNLIRLSVAKEWCTELISTNPNASSYELILIGSVDDKLSKSPKIDKVHVSEPRPLNIQFLIEQASTKLDFYYEQIGKPKISPKVREILVQTLTFHFGANSITGKEMNRQQFNDVLKDWIGSIETQIEVNPFASLAAPSINETLPFNRRIGKKLLELIGWSQFEEDIRAERVDPETGEIYEMKVDFFGDFKNKLKEGVRDVVIINSYHDVNYPSSSKEKVFEHLQSSNTVLEDVLLAKKVGTNNDEDIDFHSVLFWLTTDTSELDTNFIFNAKDNYRRNDLDWRVTYYLLDNNKANFIVSSVITAKNYRPDIPVKYFYPITEANQNPGTIGQRGTRLPVQYINSSIIPIIKEDKNTISLLLFCSDSFGEESLKKLIWLTIRLSSGFGNEYILYFPDYDEAVHGNLARSVVRSFNDDVLSDKISVQKYAPLNARVLETIRDIKPSRIKDEENTVVEAKSLLRMDKHLNEAFINILPYGDILKPFLNTEAINAADIKIFLGKKGIFVKNADKIKLVQLMSSLLFSPAEMEDFRALIDVKQRNENTTNKIFHVKNNDSLDSIFGKIRPNLDNIGEGFQTKILSPLKVIKNPQNPEEYLITSRTERKNPTSQISVNTDWGKFEVAFRKQDDKIVVSQISSISREDKLMANRVVKAIVDEFTRVDFIKEETINVMFKDFANNTDRINFFLSFTNTSSSALFLASDISSIRFKFDEGTEIPERYRDKADKDLIINFEGKSLGTLHELVDENAKKSVFLEEMKITYKFAYANISNGVLKVTYNFSNALKNKFEINGPFRSEPALSLTKSVKALAGIEQLKRTLSKEIERMKIEKLKQFNIIE